MSFTVQVNVPLPPTDVDLFAPGPVPLSSREFLLLKHLALNEGEVCTRAELLEEVWGCSFDPGTNVVDVYIRRLRAKLGKSSVETVRHAGYSLPHRPALA